MRVAVQSCVLRTTPPSCVFAERILLERMGKVKVSTNQLIMKGEETFWQSKSRAIERRSMCDGVFVCRG